MNGAIERALGSAPVASEALAGGSLGGAALVTLADGRRIVAKQDGNAATEGAMLRALAEAGAPVPQVLYGEDGLLLMEHIAADGRCGESGWSDLARVLAILQDAGAWPYGWHEDYRFGAVAIDNAPSESWPQFWGERRLLSQCPHVPADLARRLEALAARLPDLLPDRPRPALLHGDLWSGNILFGGGRVAALIDPACYHGDREVDIAMLGLFGSLPAQFYDGCELEAGWRERQPAYVLWPLLVHLRLFGDSYRSGVERALTACGV